MTVSLEEREKQYRTIYELLWSGNPRIYVKDIASTLHVDPRTASRRLIEAYNQGYVSRPQVRKRSYKNTREFVYFVKSEYSHSLYKRYSDSLDVSYHAVLGGFADLWIISKQKINFDTTDCTVLVEGPRSDYYTSFAPNHTWEKAVESMWKKAETFNPDKYTSSNIIETHWNETVEWDSQDEELYKYFKHDLRKPFTPVMRNHAISTGKIYKWLARIPECCTLSTRYFPERASSYDPYLFMFETDYENFIIELFSELPTSPFFLRVSNKIFMYTNVSRDSLRRMEPNMSDISELHITLLVDYLQEKGIIKKGADSIVKYSCSKDF